VGSNRLGGAIMTDKFKLTHEERAPFDALFKAIEILCEMDEKGLAYQLRMVHDSQLNKITEPKIRAYYNRKLNKITEPKIKAYYNKKLGKRK